CKMTILCVTLYRFFLNENSHFCLLNIIKFCSLIIKLLTFKNLLKKQMENFNREHQRYYIFVSWKNGKSANQIHMELQVAEGPKALSIRSIYRWIESFESGDENIKDDSHSGRPKEIVTPKNVAEIEELIVEDPHISIKTLEELMGISTERIHYILHNELEVSKVCAKWVPHVLTEENKEKRVELSEQLLEILEKGFNNIVTGDESWFHYFTVSSKEANKVWISKGESRTQITRTAQNSKKQMFCIFFSTEGIVTRIVVPKGQSVNAKYYSNIILPDVFSNWKVMTNKKTVKTLMLHHDNASSSHKAKI